MKAIQVLHQKADETLFEIAVKKASIIFVKTNIEYWTKAGVLTEYLEKDLEQVRSDIKILKLRYSGQLVELNSLLNEI